MSEGCEFYVGNKIVRKMFYFLFFAFLPFLFIFFIYIQYPLSGILNEIVSKVINLPAIYSSKSPVFSRVMSLYLKTAPAFAIVFFLFSFKLLKLKKGSVFSQAISVLVLFTLFYVILIYIFLFTNTNLTTSVKILAFMSKNDIYLSFFYVTLYSGIYILSFLYLWFCVGTYRLFKER